MIMDKNNLNYKGRCELNMFKVWKLSESRFLLISEMEKLTVMQLMTNEDFIRIPSFKFEDGTEMFLYDHLKSKQSEVYGELRFGKFRKYDSNEILEGLYVITIKGSVPFDHTKWVKIGDRLTSPNDEVMTFIENDDHYN